MKQRPGDDRGKRGRWGRGFDLKIHGKNGGDDGKNMEKNMEKWETNGGNPWEKSMGIQLADLFIRVFRDIFLKKIAASARKHGNSIAINLI